jgi:hypothetical protein
VKLDLPVDSQNNTPPPIDPVKNKIVVDPAGTVTWNGAPVNEVQLRQFLDLTQQMSPVPELHLQPHPKPNMSWSTKFSRSPSGPMSRPWVSSETKPTATSDHPFALQRRPGTARRRAVAVPGGKSARQ